MQYFLLHHLTSHTTSLFTEAISGQYRPGCQYNVHGHDIVASNLACDYMIWSSNEFPYHWMQCGMLDKRCRHIISSSSTLYYTNTTLNASMLLFTAIIHNKQACTLLSRKTISLACTHDVTLYCCCSARVAQGHSPVNQCYLIRLWSDLQKALRWQYFVIIQ